MRGGTVGGVARVVVNVLLLGGIGQLHCGTSCEMREGRFTGGANEEDEVRGCALW